MANPLTKHSSILRTIIPFNEFEFVDVFAIRLNPCDPLKHDVAFLPPSHLNADMQLSHLV